MTVVTILAASTVAAVFRLGEWELLSASDFFSARVVLLVRRGWMDGRDPKIGSKMSKYLQAINVFYCFSTLILYVVGLFVGRH